MQVRVAVTPWVEGGVLSLSLPPETEVVDIWNAASYGVSAGGVLTLKLAPHAAAAFGMVLSIPAPTTPDPLGQRDTL